METLKIKSIATIALIAACIGTSYAGSGKGSKNQPPLRQAKLSTNQDMAKINHQQAHIEFLKYQNKVDKASGSCVSKTELTKAKADLKRDRAYLRADKKQLKGEYQALQMDQRKAIKSERVQMREAHARLHKHLMNGNSLALQETQILLGTQGRIDQHEVALVNLRDQRSSDLALLRKELRDDEGEVAVLLPLEGTELRTENVAMK